MRAVSKATTLLVNERLPRRQDAPYAAITAVRVGEYASGFRCCAIMSAIPMIDPAVSAFVRIGETTNARLYRRHASVSTVPALTATSSTTIGAYQERKCASRADQLFYCEPIVLL